MKIPTIKGLLGTFSTRTWEPEKIGNGYFFPVGMLENFGQGRNNIQRLRDAIEVPELNAIINIRARAISSGVVEIVSKETGKRQSDNQSLVRVLRNPNWYQSQKEFWRLTSMIRDIFGEEFIYFLKPYGMSDTYQGMYTINPTYVTIKNDIKTPLFLTDKNDGISYIYTFNGKEYPIDASCLVHLNDNKIDADNDLRGASLIDSLQGPIKNIRAAYQKRNIVLNMPVGILSNDQKDAIGGAISMDDDEKADLRERIKKQQGLPIITNLPVRYEDMTINSQNLGLFEEVREDTAKLCDSFGVPYEVLASQKGTTFTNLKEAKKQMYEETIIPTQEERIDGLNRAVMTAGKPWEIRVTYSHLPVFSEDIKQRAISLNQLVSALSQAMEDGAITIDQYRAELNKYGIK